jgi:hypothetical protein
VTDGGVRIARVQLDEQLMLCETLFREKKYVVKERSERRRKRNCLDYLEFRGLLLKFVVDH